MTSAQPATVSGHMILPSTSSKGMSLGSGSCSPG